MSDPESKHLPACPKCGRVLSQTDTLGLCPVCLGRVAFKPGPQSTSLPPLVFNAIRFFGDYELIEEIARGGMGVIYRARQIRLKREVAIKLMLHGVLASDEDVQRFQSEATAAASLKHPGIVAIHEVGDVEGLHFFSMDLVSGRDLAEATRLGPLSVRQGAELAGQIARAVQHAHEHGILHRDLKPSNVILDEQGRAHVTDFGLARNLDGRTDLTRSGQALGTPGYMAPEQAAGRPSDVSTAADVYGIGAVLYHLLTGRAPFTGESVADVLRQVVEQEPVAPGRLNPLVPRDLETICLKCLSPNPARRYVSAAELADDLDRFLRQEPIHARPIGKLERFTRWCGRNPALAASFGVVAFLLVALLAGAFVAAHRIDQSRRAEIAQRHEAEARLHQGEKLINFMLGDLSDRLEPVGRLDVLESAIGEVNQYYSAIPVTQMIPESRGHRAKALFQIAAIRASQGRFAGALPDYYAAIAAYTNLIAAYPTNLEWQYDLTRTLNDLGFAYARMEDQTNALAVWGRCLQLRGQLIELQPTNVIWLAAYGATAQNLGQSYRRLKRFAEAGDSLHRADIAFRRWVASEPGSALPKERLAMICGSRGQLYQAEGELDQAARAYAEKVRILRDLLRADPENTRIQAGLEGGLSYVGILAGLQTNYAGALAALDEGIAVGESLVARDPANIEWQLDLVVGLTERGQILEQQEKPAEALRSFGRVWELSRPQSATASQYPNWMRNWRSTLDGGAQAEDDLAAQAEAAGQPAEATAHRKRSVALRTELAALVSP